MSEEKVAIPLTSRYFGDKEDFTHVCSHGVPLDGVCPVCEALLRHAPKVEMVDDNGHTASENFRNDVCEVLYEIETMLINKNKSYGNSALNPVRIFSRVDAMEQLKVRIDDKLSRISRGSEFLGDDTVSDLIGYLVLFKIALNKEEGSNE